jgi:hypothetical protein
MALAVAALAGCATMSQRDCQLADWHSAGLSDASKGLPMTRLAEYTQACSQYNVSPDLTAYRVGYDLGLKSYCKDSNGFAVGSSGEGYQGVCPANLEPQFLTGYRAGHTIFVLHDFTSRPRG